MAEPSEARDVLLNQLADEFAARHRAGERPSLQEYCDRHPDLADDLRELFPALVELERAKADAGPELAVAIADAPPVTRVGDFRLLREVGRGGMGVVYEAEQVSLGRRVAIKLLPAAVFREPTKRKRFEREAKAAARLHHTNIVPVHGFGEHDGTPYYVMQFIPGLGLDAVIDELGRASAGGRATEPNRRPTVEGAALSVALARSLLGEGGAGTAGWQAAAEDAPTMTAAGGATPDPAPPAAPPTRPDRGPSGSHSVSGIYLPGQSGSAVGGTSGKRTTYWESVARIGVQVGGALAYAHRQGVLHRDVKPANLLLDLDGVVWVTDFGLAKADDSDDLTHTGDLLGTLRYMPPEAFEGRSDARGDVYGLGLTLYELVALRPAYEERDRNKLIKQVTSGDPPPLRKLRRDAPRDLVTIVEKATEKDPVRRYQTAGGLADDLQRFLDGRPITARRATELERLWMWARRRPAMAGLVAALFLCLLAGSVVSTVFAVRADAFARDADLRKRDAESARDAARRNADEAERQKVQAEEARLAALDQTYLATRNEIRAMRLARQSGWRSAALERLRGLVQLRSRNLDLVDLRGEALVCLAELDVRAQSKIAVNEKSIVWHVRHSPDGRTLAINDTVNSRVRLHDLETNRDLPSIPKSVGLAPFAFHPGGALALPRAAGRVAIHSLRPGQPSFPEIAGDGHALSLSFSRSGDRMAVVWGEVNLEILGLARKLRRVTVHETATGATLWAVDLPKNCPGYYKVALALSPDGRSLATVGPDNDILLYSVGTDAAPVVVGNLRSRVYNIKFHPNGQSLVAGAHRIAAVWDLKSRSELFRMHIAEGGCWEVTYSPDGQLLAGACDGKTVRLWDSRSGAELAVIPAECGSVCLSADFSPCGERLAVGGGSVTVFEIEGRRECRRDTSTLNNVIGLAFERSKPALLSSGGDRHLCSWNLSEPSTSVFRDHGRQLNCRILRVAPDGRQLAIGFEPFQNSDPNSDYSISVWHLDDRTSERRLRGPKQGVLDVDFNPSGTCLAATSPDGGLYFWEFGTGVLRYRRQLDRVGTLRFVDDNRLLVAGGNRLLVLSAGDGAIRHEVTFPTTVATFVINPNKSEALVGTSDGRIHRVRLPDLAITQTRTLLDQPSDLRMAISPDARLLAVGTSIPAGVRNLLVDPRTLEPLARLPEYDQQLHCMEFSADGRHLAIAGKLIVLWDLARVRAELTRLGLGESSGLATD